MAPLIGALELVWSVRLGLGGAGIGASGLALVSQACNDNLTKCFLAVSHLRKQQPLMLKITNDTVAWRGPTDMPEACWQKGSTTTLVCVPCLAVDIRLQVNPFCVF